MWTHPAALARDDLAGECRETFGRRSGPGGQHRNKVETAVAVVHTPTGIRAEASERRSQAENRSVAWRRLRRALALEYRSPEPPTQAQLQDLLRRFLRQGRFEIADSNDSFPTLLAAVFDILHDEGYEIGKAAARLGTSTGQLNRFLKKHRDAWQRLNDARQQRGLKRLT